jgi:hypothetical protein
MMKIVPLEQLNFDSFASLTGTKFRVWIGPDDSVELELTEATAPHPGSIGGTDQPQFETFSVMFVGPGDRLLAQRIYTFEGEPIGRFDLFIVPVGRDAKGIRYQATFSRLVKPG